MKQPRPFPVLATERLKPRAVDFSDANFYYRLLSIAEVTRFSDLPDRATKAQAERFVAWMAKLFDNKKSCAWIIEARRDGTSVGAIRINRIHRPWRWGEIGYESHPDFWGRGVMTEAVRAVVTCGHRGFGLNRMEAWTLPGNDASDRVLTKAGFVYEGALKQKAWFKGAYHDFRMFGRVAADPLE